MAASLLFGPEAQQAEMTRKEFRLARRIKVDKNYVLGTVVLQPERNLYVRREKLEEMGRPGSA
jgi:hypothetical protein